MRKTVLLLMAIGSLAACGDDAKDDPCDGNRVCAWCADVCGDPPPCDVDRNTYAQECNSLCNAVIRESCTNSVQVRSGVVEFPLQSQSGEQCLYAQVRCADVRMPGGSY